MKRKLISLMLILCVFCTMTLPAVNAVDLMTENRNMDALAEINLDAEDIVDSSTDDDGNAVYTYFIGSNTTGTVTVKWNSDGEVTLDVWEGSNNNVVSILADGTMFVDGQVLPEAAETVVTIALPEAEAYLSAGSEILPRVAVQHRFSSYPFHGNGGEYTVNVGTYVNPSVPFYREIRMMTVALVAEVIAERLFPGNQPAQDAFADIAENIAEDVKTKAEETADNSMALSYKVYVRSHPDSNSFDNYLIHAGRYYCRMDYRGESVVNNFYEHRFFYS